eukprot:TRINITY_DN10295_c0_g1_i1.p1 TRINITY_DN10295_c0_g1~~TRINITY_DN10295_c0_g1_i1.p1  ORF type:complete len:503 (+),score=85.99 TRINITY_DN10295_c0_g1_i1:75-1511(+)
MAQNFMRLIQMLANQGLIHFPEESSSDDVQDDQLYTSEKQTLEGNDIVDAVMSDTATTMGSSVQSVHSLVNQREYSRGRVRRQVNRALDTASCHPFGSVMKSHVMHRYIPNTSQLLRQHQDGVFCSLFSDNGKMFMSACKDQIISIYDTDTWSVRKSIMARDIGWSIISTDFSPDGNWLIYSSWSDFVHIINTTGEHETHESLDMRPQGGRFCLFSSRFSPDSREILGGSSDGHIYIFDLDRRERIERIEGHVDDINAVAYADHSNQIFFSGSDDSLIKGWDRRIGGKMACIGVFPGHSSGITYIDSKKDGRYFISNGKDQCMKLWDIRAMQNESDFDGRPTNFQYNTYFAHEQMQRYQSERRLKHDKSIMTYFGPQQILQTLIRCKFSPSYSTGQKYLYTGSADGCIYIFDILTGELVDSLKGHKRTVRDMHWHPYLPCIASSSWDGTVKLWNYNPEQVSESEHTTESSSDDYFGYY